MSAAACTVWFIVGGMVGGSVGFVAFALLASSADRRRHARPREGDGT